MDERKKIEYDRIFRALGDKHRLQILDLLMERDMNAGELLELVNVVQSTLSHHMKTLCDSGLVIPRRERKWTYYTVSAEKVELAREFLKRYLAAEVVAEAPEENKEEVVAEAPEENKEEVAAEAPEENKEEAAAKVPEKNKAKVAAEVLEEKEEAAAVEVPEEKEADAAADTEEEPFTLYASMKSSKKKKTEKGKKDSDKKKESGKKKEKKENDKKKVGKKKDKKGSKKEKAAEE